jgi:hypothetical protein
MNKKKDEIHELIGVEPKVLRKYYVLLTWFTDDVLENLFNMKMVPIDIPDDVELLSTKYEVMAMTINEAINQAGIIDKARKMEMLTAYHEVIYMASKEGKCNYDYETIESFREYMIQESSFTDFFLNDPTSISAYLVDNEKLVTNKTINNAIEVTENIGDSMEEWLQNHDDKKDKNN